MTNDEIMTKFECRNVSKRTRLPGFVLLHSFIIRHLSFAI
jgi:hypothetical protein